MSEIKPLKPRPLEVEQPQAKKPIERAAAKQSLFFSDGFFFGCGFWAAGFLFFVVIIPLGTLIVMMVAAMLGVAISR